MKKEINLYLDDLRMPPKNFVLVKDVKNAKEFLKNYNINILSLDHDLGKKETGYDLVKYMCLNNIYVKEIYIHTDNPVGRENMYYTLLAAQKRGFIAQDIKIHNYKYK